MVGKVSRRSIFVQRRPLNLPNTCETIKLAKGLEQGWFTTALWTQFSPLTGPKLYLLWMNTAVRVSVWHLQSSSCKLAKQQPRDSRPWTYKGWQGGCVAGSAPPGCDFSSCKEGTGSVAVEGCSGQLSEEEWCSSCFSCPLSQQNQTNSLESCCPVSSLQAFFFFFAEPCFLVSMARSWN